MDFAERKKRSRRNGCSRNRKTRGGAYTAAYTFGGPISPEAYYANRVDAITNCGTPTRPVLNPGSAGLPGMAGGRRRKTRRNNTMPLSLNVQGIYNTSGEAVASPPIPVANNEVLEPLNAKMVGGRWGFGTPEVVGDAGIALSARERIPCGQGGGAWPSYSVPTAGYTNVPSDRMGGASGTLYDGKTPYMVQVPYAAKTCGGKRKQRKSRKSRKQRKQRRKHRRN